MRLPVLPIVFLFILSFLIDLYIFFDIKRITKKKLPLIIYGLTTLVCWAILIVAVSLPIRSGNSDISTVMWLLYVFLSIYIAKLTYIVITVVGLLLALTFRLPKNNAITRWIGIGLGVILCGVLWIGVGYTRHHIEIVKVDLKSTKVPREFNGYKIVQISDLHVGTWGTDTTFISNLVRKVNSLNPDLIVFTGDLVNRMTNEIYPFLGPLSGLKAKDGVLSVLGNHDYGDYVNWNSPEERENNNRELAFHEKAMGWHLMNNEHIFFKRGNDSIMVIGVENWGDPPFPVYGDLETALSSSTDSLNHQNDKNFKILLSHNPEHWNRVVSKITNIDLTLSGHTHAMQVLFKLGDWKWSPAKYRYEQWGGLFSRENEKGQMTNLYVNIGAGEVGMPARLLSAYPEITLITLIHEK